jgi:hypothetical protein
MADNSRSKSEKSNQQNDAAAGQRRAFMRKAAAVGLPVVLATVQPRTAWATGNGQKPSTAGSANPSGPGNGPGGGRGRGNGGPGWTRPGGWDRD